MTLNMENPVIRRLVEGGVMFSVHHFEYQLGGGTERSSRCLGIDEHAVVKTLVFEDEARQPLVVLMHGDCKVDTAKLAERSGVSKIWACAPPVAEKLSGWPVGATNPFVLKTEMPVFLQETVLELKTMYINGGGRGLLVALSPTDFLKVVNVRLVRCAKEKPMVGSKAP